VQVSTTTSKPLRQSKVRGRWCGVVLETPSRRCAPPVRCRSCLGAGVELCAGLNARGLLAEGLTAHVERRAGHCATTMQKGQS
jgi:hypothetical protein